MSASPPSASSPAGRLRALLAQDRLVIMPCCFDALSAKLIEQAGFPLTFMSGFAASASRIGAPDMGLMSYAEVLDQGRNICEAVDILVIGDGDTGYGNAMNVRRTVRGFAQAGFAAVMIEDQVAPKRCGHVRGKAVVGRAEAYDRIRAAVDARDELKARGEGDILILARTDARHDHGMAEAIERARTFHELGADILFVEAPRSGDEMTTIGKGLPGVKMANLLEGGDTPVLPPALLQEMGFRIAAYPLTLMSAAMKAMIDALETLKSGTTPDGMLLEFSELRRRVGFDAYATESERYAAAKRT